MDTVHIKGDSGDFTLSRLFDEVKVTSGSTSQTLEAIEFVSFNDQIIELSELPAALSAPFDTDEATENKVVENAGIGTYTGITVNATAADPDDFITLTLLDDAAGRFALNSDGQIVTASSIDFEVAESHLITVEARTESGLITANTFEILVEDDFTDEPQYIVLFEFNRNFPNIVPEEDIVLNYELASYIHRDNFHRIYQAVVEDAGYEHVGYSWSGDYLFSDSGHLSESGYNNHLNTSGYKPAYSDLLPKLEELNSKLTLIDGVVSFKAGQTTESESLVVRVEGELPEFINLVSSDLMVDDEPGEGGQVLPALYISLARSSYLGSAMTMYLCGKMQKSLLCLLWSLSLIAIFRTSFLKRILFSTMS